MQRQPTPREANQILAEKLGTDFHCVKISNRWVLLHKHIKINLNGGDNYTPSLRVAIDRAKSVIAQHPDMSW